MPHPPDRRCDVVVLGGGQSGLAVGYHLRRALSRLGASFVILDAEAGPGGAWRHGWDSLRLFSPALWSSLPGWPMPRALGPAAPAGDAYPHRDDVLAYLARYEERYELPVERPVRVRAVRRAEGDAAYPLVVEAEREGAPEMWRTRAVVSATGTWAAPYVAAVPGREAFRGDQLHSACYRSPAPFAGRRVLVVGGGNSGAQLMAELSQVADATWVTLEAPRFLPDDVDGRVLFDAATARYHALRAGEDPGRPYSLGDVVVVPPVRAARDAGRLATARPFARMTPTGVVWPDGREEAVDAVIWCTGFRPALDHLRPLGVVDADGRVVVEGTRAVAEPRLWLVGYGGWTGFASATLIGVGRSAKATAEEVADAIAGAG